MSHAEHTALATRVDRLAAQILAVEPRRIRTVFRVYRRGAEQPCKTAADAHRLAKLDPVVELVGEYPDLDVLIDTETGARIQRAANDTSFDELAEGVETIDVAITCYEGQLRQILSDAPITATTGGTRAGKTRVLVWWLFRQWLILGHGVDDRHEKEATFWWLREGTSMLYEHAIAWLLRLWPAGVFTGKLPTANTLNPKLHLVDGSVVAFKHAGHSGMSAGKNLKSESVAACVIDELAAILNKENFREAKRRLAQNTGPMAVAFTPTPGHWSAELAKGAPSSGGAIVVRKLTMFDNCWWAYASMWVDLLKDLAVTATELEEKILSTADPVAAALEVVTDPHVRRMSFGEEMALGLTLWREWSDELRVSDRKGLRSTFRGLPNVSAAVVGGYFATGGRAATAWGGKDFNFNPGIGVVLQAFGDPARPVVLVVDEVATVGPTLRNAEEIAERYPGLPHFCDPTGAMYMHPVRGSASTKANATDVEEMRRAGLPCQPAAGRSKNSVRHLSRHDSVNVMHRAMKENLFFVHERCTGVLRAMTDMQCGPDGLPVKTSGLTSISDQISGYGDAVRYGVWRAYQSLLIGGASVQGGNGAPS